MGCEQHEWRLAETDFYEWLEQGGRINRKSIFGNTLYWDDFHYGRVDKFYCVHCTERKTERVEAIGDYSRQPEWWSWQGLDSSASRQVKHHRPHAMDWGLRAHQVYDLLREQVLNYG
jgi:hypothetical protein